MTTGHCFYFILTMCKSRRRSWAFSTTTIWRSRRNEPSWILHLTYSLHNSKRVRNLIHFSLFKFSLLHNLKYIINKSGPMVDVQTVKFKTIVLVRSFSTPLVGQHKFLMNLKMLTLQVMTSFSTLSPLILYSSARTVTNSRGAQRRRQCPCFSF